MAEAAIAEDLTYLVLIGPNRWISSYVEKGEVIEKGKTVSVGPIMGQRLLGATYMHSKSSEMVPYWREATDAEAEAYINRLELVDPATGDPRLVAEAARREARGGGMVEKGEMKELDRQEAEEEKLQPKKKARRQRRSETADDE